jgi:hypothetical protein
LEWSHHWRTTEKNHRNNARQTYSSHWAERRGNWALILRSKLILKSHTLFVHRCISEMGM